MTYQVSDLTNFLVPDNPLSAEINAIITAEYQRILTSNSDDSKRSIEDALYFSAKKRFRERPYLGGRTAYLSGLLSDIQDAGREFGEVAYESEQTRDTFWNLKMGITGLL